MGFFKNKRILITGGTGSFGTELVRKLLSIEENIFIKIYSRDEKKQEDMSKLFFDDRLNFVIGDIRDREALMRALEGIDFVFHASALKQILVGEKFPEEVIKTNVFGLLNLVNSSEIQKVKKIVNLSSDKAAYPVNAYGMTKALSEKIIQAHSGSVVCVNLRYGNVIASRNSVIPIFLDQIKNEKPLTVTNRYMTRFLLPLPDAVELSMLCMKDGNSGELFVIKSPAATIETLVESISGSSYDNANVTEIGIRPGEKMHETLLTSAELLRSELRCRGKMEYYVVKKELESDFRQLDRLSTEDFTSENTVRFDVTETLNLLKKAGLL